MQKFIIEFFLDVFMLTKEQSEIIKKQLLDQLEQSSLENKEQIKEYIQKLEGLQLEEFLKKNKIMINNPNNSSDFQNPNLESNSDKCIFCSIIKGDINSHKIDENKKSIAILEINPFSRGHIIIIPIQHVSIDKIPKSSLSLAQNIAKRIKSKLKSEDVKIETSNFQGHSIINVIPLYKNQEVKRKKIDEKELNELQELLKIKKRAILRPKKIKKQVAKGLPEISFRIP